MEQAFVWVANARCQTLVAVKCFDFFMLLIQGGASILYLDVELKQFSLWPQASKGCSDENLITLYLYELILVPYPKNDSSIISRKIGFRLTLTLLLVLDTVWVHMCNTIWLKIFCSPFISSKSSPIWSIDCIMVGARGKEIQ